MNSTIPRYLTFTNFSATLLAAAIMLMFIAPIYTPITIVAWVVVSLAAAIIRRNRVELKLELVLSGLLYFFYIIGVLWSENKESAYFDLEVKLSLIIVPLVIALVRYHVIQLRLIIYAFLMGLIVGLTIIFSTAIHNCLSGGSFNELFYIKLSPDIHPSYFNFYLNIASSILLLDYQKNKLNLFKRRWIYVFLIFLFSMCSIFLLSKIGMVTATMILLTLLAYWFMRKKYGDVLLLMLLGTSIVYGVYFRSDSAQERVTEFIEAIDEGPNQHYPYSTTLRMEIWKVSWENFVESPWIGYGTGDVGDAMQRKYIEKKMERAITLRLNSHNQFLQITLGTGIFGFFILAALLLFPLIRYKRNFYYGAGLSIIAGIFFLTESVLETQAGVVGFIIFYSLLNSLDTIFDDTEKPDLNDQ